ncbi:unnamed protein product [Caenorhabditis auriculariae]|uniref:Uncharacterized protein n=1 Tax=Caenorhabditis auriculariae TaxID=2777116 RepID=A0A8S1HSD3_9PELO|nr:unnamed protein product [Caenorhabditis auriculariae]
MKVSPAFSAMRETDDYSMDEGGREGPKEVSQHADVQVSKVLFPNNDPSTVLWLGQTQGRCIGLWRRDFEARTSFDPFRVVSVKNVDVDPMDACSCAPNISCVSFLDGSLAVLNTKNDDISLVKKIESIHDGCESRAVCTASSNGNLERVDLETGQSTTVVTGQSGLRSVCTAPGGHLVFTGSSTGQLGIWDLRQANDEGQCTAYNILVPSKKPLDGVTALCSHPAQSNLLCCGTNEGLIGFIDIRNGADAVISGTYVLSPKTITQVSFHPSSPDNLLCSSADGSLLRLDATAVTSAAVNGQSRSNVWLTGSELAHSLRIEPLRNAAQSSVTSFACQGDVIVASTSLGVIHSYEKLPFFPALTSTFA